MKNQEAINRKEFLMKMGFGGAALMAALTSCSTDGVSASSSVTSFSIDLSSSTYAALKTVGGYVKTNGVIIARIATGDASSAYAAIARICPHEKKDSIIYETSTGKFRCTAHNWYFKTSGAGSGNASISAYTVALAGTTLTIA